MPLSLLGLVSVEVGIAWMMSRSGDQLEAYLLGLSLPVYATAFLLVWHWYMTVLLAFCTAVAISVFSLGADPGLDAQQVATITFYLVTAFALAIASQVYRERKRWQDHLTQTELEAERQRNAALVGELEQLSREDPLTRVMGAVDGVVQMVRGTVRSVGRPVVPGSGSVPASAPPHRPNRRVEPVSAHDELAASSGEDNVIRGTDAIWYGPSQIAIHAFRAFEIPVSYQQRYGDPALTPGGEGQDPRRQRGRVSGITLDAAARAATDDLAWVRDVVAEFRARGVPIASTP